MTTIYCASRYNLQLRTQDSRVLLQRMRTTRLIIKNKNFLLVINNKIMIICVLTCLGRDRIRVDEVYPSCFHILPGTQNLSLTTSGWGSGICLLAVVSPRRVGRGNKEEGRNEEHMPQEKQYVSCLDPSPPKWNLPCPTKTLGRNSDTQLFYFLFTPNLSFADLKLIWLEIMKTTMLQIGMFALLGETLDVDMA